MKKIVYAILCGAVVLMAAGMKCPAQEPDNTAAVNSETGKVVMDSETAKIAAEWRKQDVPPPEVLQVAQEEYALNIPPEEALLPEWGVTVAALKSASLGEPFRKYTITWTSLHNYRKGDTVASIVSKTNEWQFPVLVNNELKLTFDVAKMRQGWAPVGFGCGLEKELNEILHRWPKSKGYHPVFIEIPGGGNFFTVPEKDPYNLTLIPIKPIMPYEEKRITYPRLDTLDNIVHWLTPLLEEKARRWPKRVK